jgi:hypothetical protein
MAADIVCNTTAAFPAIESWAASFERPELYAAWPTRQL